jgi:hypothetical protein
MSRLSLGGSHRTSTMLSDFGAPQICLPQSAGSPHSKDTSPIASASLHSYVRQLIREGVVDGAYVHTLHSHCAHCCCAASALQACLCAFQWDSWQARQQYLQQGSRGRRGQQQQQQQQDIRVYISGGFTGLSACRAKSERTADRRHAQLSILNTVHRMCSA